jgi:hypothetical protein
MHLYLAIAGTSVNAFSILGLGGIGGILAGLFGTGGGFLLTPLLIMLGIPPAVAAASDSNQIVAASCSGALAHRRMGNVDLKMGGIYLSGALLGGVAGTKAVHVLCNFGQYNVTVRIFYTALLALIGGFFFYESVRALRWNRTMRLNCTLNKLCSRLPFQTEFRVSGIKTSIILVVALGAFVGFLAAMLGIGGGFITIPVMIYLLGVPTLIAVGTGLFQILFTSINVTFLQAVYNHNVDVMLAALLFIGAAIGAQLGARLSRFFRPEQLRLVLSLVLLGVMVKLSFGLFNLSGYPVILLREGFNAPL